MQIFTNNYQLWIAGAIVVIGLVGLGFGDLARFSLKRVWAISSVNFAESIRRRVLLITPLAIVGVIAVAQLQRPVDEADAIRETIKFCLFATGLVVTVVTIILASTNLPREIDNRVIYTVVTKPTTRLEIILGKILGFARVSAAILLIMGLFTWGYLHVRSWSLQRDIAMQLKQGEGAAGSRASLEHFQKAGLLGARTYTWAQSLGVYAKPPAADDRMRWVLGNSEQEILIPFDVPAKDLVPDDFEPGKYTPPNLLVVLHVAAKQRPLTKEEIASHAGQAAETTAMPAGPLGPALPATGQAARSNAATQPVVPPRLTFNILDQSQFLLISSDKLIPKDAQIVPADFREPMQFQIPGNEVPTLQKAGRFYLQILTPTVGTQYGVLVPEKPEESPAVIAVPQSEGKPPRILASVRGDGSGQVFKPIFRGRSGNYGQQLRGGEAEGNPVGIYSFRQADLRPDGSGNVSFELKVGIEKSGNDEVEDDDLTRVDVSAVNPTTLAAAATTTLYPETNHTAYFQLPASALNGGNFDLMLRNRTAAHWVGLKPTSLGLVDPNDSFGFNLLKSLTILWLMSVLAIVVAVFCSTFLTWPIAIVLTIVILLGHWGVEQLGDATDSGFGNRFATDMGLAKDAAQAKVVSSTVEGLAHMLSTFSNVLPDISQFQASEDVERGISIPHQRLLEALYVSLGFGLPLAVLAYIVLKNKEVAP
jgi:hypothetical protein